MKSEWTTRSIHDIAEINPRESISKGALAKKIPMDALQPFTRDIPSYQIEEFKGGTKFRNGDTIILNSNQVGRLSAVGQNLS